MPRRTNSWNSSLKRNVKPAMMERTSARKNNLEERFDETVFQPGRLFARTAHHPA